MSASDNALALEAVKISMRQSKDGVAVTFVLHPHEDQGVLAELLGHPVGTRYMMGLAQLAEDGTIQPRQRKTSGERAVVSAGMLAKEPKFQKWLYDRGLVIDMGEEQAAFAICKHCGIMSRSELRTNEVAVMAFDKMKMEFGLTQ